ncbi:MAG TPA: glycogen debranching protein GlgX [Caulobacteraceae bacterium]|nr:glycogen debranching protein GlgX [Caulobacteraceae bacterium]
MGWGAVSEGQPGPLGVWPSGDGVNVAVWSGSATGIDICLFDADGRERRIPLPARTGPVFHGHVAGVAEGARYGLRAQGPFDPAAGLRFDPSKLLVDPYAVALDRPFALSASQFSPDQNSADQKWTDSAADTPKGVVTAPAPPGPPPLIAPWRETVIYEAHVKGLTQRHPDVPEAQRGTFAALAHPAIVRHLKDLGVTTLELLPVAAWIDERHLQALSLTNYWGYNPVAFCAPDPRLAPGGWSEVRAATTALAEAGIETVLDVVFNHSGEGDHLGPTLSLRGLDNPGYYRLNPADRSRYIDDSGTGNTLALDRPQGVALAMEAMRAWVRRGGVSGFRFDLATVLGRRDNGYDPSAPLLAAIDQDPELRGLKLIAEPWDCGLGGYQLGTFPGAWGEWNDQYRDGLRRFWRGDQVPLGRLADAWAGSQRAMAGHGRPSRSVNFITAHDGFTLADLVSYEAKHNEANGEHNRDGTDNNSSWNGGAEGPTGDPAILARRARDQRALLSSLLLSRGAPMLSMGAELGQTQHGNNNAYCQDGPLTWLDWPGANPALIAFVGRLTAARRQHAALRADRFLTGEASDTPYTDVQWLRPDGAPMAPHEWDDPHGASLTIVLAAKEDGGALDRVAIVVHRGDQSLAARLPDPRDGFGWTLLTDSADDARTGPFDGDAFVADARSVALLAETPTKYSPRGVSDDVLAEVADAAGVAREWWTLDGERHLVSPQTQSALLAAMGMDIAAPGQAREALWALRRPDHLPLPLTQVVREGEAASTRGPLRDALLEVLAEDGTVTLVKAAEGRAPLQGLRPGRYRIRSGPHEGRLIVAPRRAFQPELTKGRLLGLSAQLYGVRTDQERLSMGDLGTLATLCEQASGQGLDLVGINPLHALFPHDRSKASPYYPSDRRFLDPIHIGLDGVLAKGAPETGWGGMVDYAAVWARKSDALEQLFKPFEQPPPYPDAFSMFIAKGGDELERFAAFQAIAELYPERPWQTWPDGLDNVRGPAVDAFIATHRSRVRYHQYLQWMADTQLETAAAAAPGLGLYRDLAVGAAPDGAEIWAGAGQFAKGVSIGAPPDPLGPQGQVWGMPPPDPQAWLRTGYDGFSGLLRSNMRHAGALRIDHVLGLSRLFWVPEGAEAADGTYVAYPLQDLLGVLALESVDHRCLVIGEDLGTAPEGLRPALEQNGVYSYKVLPFEREGQAFRPPDHYPERALACIATHDLPPLAGWWLGADIEERRELNLFTAPEADQALRERADDKTALLEALVGAGLIERPHADPPMDDALAAAIHAYVASSACHLVLAQIEDLAGERHGVNLPGTNHERPNWQKRLSLTLPELWSSERCRAILDAMRQARKQA